VAAVPAAHLRADLRDPACFARVFDEHARGVHVSAQAVLRDEARAEDVVQDVFLRLWRRPDSYDASRGPLGSYLRLMARSRALDLWREAEVRDRTRRRVEADADAVTPPTADAPDAAALRAADRAAIVDALAVLPSEQRHAVALAYWGGLTAEEIADRSGVPLGTVKSRIRLGLHKLRRSLMASAGTQMPIAA